MRVDRLVAAHDPHEHLGHVALELDVRVDDVLGFLVAAAVGAEEIVDVLLGDLAVDAAVVLVEGVELFAGELGVVDAARLVVHLALLRVAEHAVHLLQRLELAGGVGGGVLVGVQPKRRLVVRLLDLRGGRLLRQAQDLVQILAVQAVVAAGGLLVRVGHLRVVALGGGLARVHLALAAGHRAPRNGLPGRTRGSRASDIVIFQTRLRQVAHFFETMKSPLESKTRAMATYAARSLTPLIARVPSGELCHVAVPTSSRAVFASAASFTPRPRRSFS